MIADRSNFGGLAKSEAQPTLAHCLLMFILKMHSSSHLQRFRRLWQEAIADASQKICVAASELQHAMNQAALHAVKSATTRKN